MLRARRHESHSRSHQLKLSEAACHDALHSQSSPPASQPIGHFRIGAHGRRTRECTRTSPGVVSNAARNNEGMVITHR